MPYVVYVWQPTSPHEPVCARVRHEWLFRLRFAQGRVARIDLAPTLAAFVSKSVILMPPRFGTDFSSHARLVAFVETHQVRTFDAERDHEVFRKPSLHAIRESRIARVRTLHGEFSTGPAATLRCLSLSSARQTQRVQRIRLRSRQDFRSA